MPIHLRVITFNILGCRGFPLAPAGPVVFDQPTPRLLEVLAARLVAWRADVVILQETPPEDAVRTVARLAGMEMAYFPAQAASSSAWPFGFPGAILSRHPLSEVRDLATTVRGQQDARFHRHWGVATVAVPGRPLRVTGTHLCADWGEVFRESTRLAELEAILAAAPTDLIGADCNTRPGEAPWRRLREAGWRDGWIESGAAGDGLTSDTRTRIQRIDYLWLAPATPWRAVGATVITDDLVVEADGQQVLLSDHHPVAVDLVCDAT
jgi:endonuclease/exonuclease/phosphatase family metal-dependent hydrolase